MKILIHLFQHDYLEKANYEVGDNEMDNNLLTVSEVARILRVDDATVRRWVKQGVLEAVVLPHVHSRQVYRIKRETLDRVLGDSNIQ
jgi:excisionase family DNA binding protein